MKKQTEKEPSVRKQRNIKEKRYLDADRLDSLLIKEGRGAAAKLAEELNVEPQAVSNYRRGIADPTMDNLVKIAEHYHVSIDWLLGRLPLENKSDNEIVREAAEYTGLSTESIDNLHRWTIDPDEIGVTGINRLQYTIGKNYPKTLNVIIEHAGWGSLLEAIYDYLKAAPEPFTISTLDLSHEPSDSDDGMGMNEVPLGTFFDGEVVITYANGEGFVLTKEGIKDMALHNILEAAKKLDEKVWKEWAEKHGKH